jgi:FKBP-type peptidyl-prolyl cis-trans isomerase FkpA
MKVRQATIVLILATCAVACGQKAEQTPAVNEEPEVTETDTMDIDSMTLAPGLTAKILRAGDGQAAQAGDNVEVHYTGWLYDESAANNRGDKFDSSVDRGQRFQFPLGAGRVIKGWDQGVAGMQIGEVRELTIAPEMAYGDRGAGSAIPPGATLVFEVELFSAESLGNSGS